jgi:hypothetical protein
VLSFGAVPFTAVSVFYNKGQKDLGSEQRARVNVTESFGVRVKGQSGSHRLKLLGVWIGKIGCEHDNKN